MANKPSAPKKTWVGSVQKVEHAINRHSKKITGTERFSALMNQGSKLKLVIKQAVAEQMGNYLRTMNMPTKTQVDGIGERLDALEESLERLQRMLPRAQGERPRPEPKRSRKPPLDPA
jgi:polyhydroxyalkanoate synthesis regulator phasin